MCPRASAKDWKAITMDWTDLQSYDHSEQLAICLTQREAAILKALLTPAYWSTRWTNLTATPDELDEFVANIDSQLDGNDCEVCDMQFRDNPADPCEVQYRNSDSDPWTTMFRKDNCKPGTTSVDITNIYNDITEITNNNTTWAGDIVNIAPKWGYVDADSDKSLCWAINFYVDWVCDMSIAQIKSGNAERRAVNDWLDDLSDMLGGAVVATIAFFAATPITMPAVALTAIAWATTQIVDDIWDWIVTKDYSDFEDEDARQIIKCTMYEAMEGATPQWVPWRDSVNYFTSFGGAEQSIAGAVHKMNQSVDVYINYMLLMEELNDISATLPVCPCPDRWSHTWDFVNNGPEAWELLGQAWGHFEAGVGFVGDPNDDPGRISNTIWELWLNEAIPRCDQWTFFYTAVRGTWDQNVYSLKMYHPPAATETQNSGWFSTGTSDWTTYPGLNDFDYLAVLIRSCYTNTGPGGYGSIIITKMVLEGEGTDPFSGRDTG